MSIINMQKDVSSDFLEGRVVFKITSSPLNKLQSVTDHTLSISIEEYILKYNSHEFIALVDLAPLHYKIAYLYGCLNMQKGVKRNEIFMTWYREIHKHEWRLWFIVNPYE